MVPLHGIMSLVANLLNNCWRLYLTWASFLKPKLKAFQSSQNCWQGSEGWKGMFTQRCRCIIHLALWSFRQIVLYESRQKVLVFHNDTFSPQLQAYFINHMYSAKRPRIIHSESQITSSFPTSPQVSVSWRQEVRIYLSNLNIRHVVGVQHTM